MIVMRLCPACAEKMRQVYYMVETGAKQRIGACSWCMPPREAVLTQYEMTPIDGRNRKKLFGPPKRDTRARYREPFREEGEADW